MRKLIKKYSTGHIEFTRKAETAERYYRNKNDVLYKKRTCDEDDNGENPLRNADNRISTNFYGLLVNQKAGYMFTAPPLFDAGSDEVNQKIVKFLGDKYAKICKDLCVSAANSGVRWLHIWKDDNGILKYGVVDSAQVIPIWSDDLDNELEAVLRIYPHTDENGDRFKVCQYWNKEECCAYSYKMSDTDEAIYKSLKEFDMFAVVNGAGGLAEYKNVLSHGFGEVPFIPFFNNNNYSGDLWNVKPLIDTYDKVFSGFVDDLEDIQEVIFVLSGYGGESGEKFLQELKKYKTVNIDNTEGGSLTTLNIEIPVEARKEMLILCRKAIFEQGQGVDPDPQNFGNSSGVALKFLYSLLDLKAGLAETEFKLGFGRLIRMICGQWGFEPEQIIQTWTRTAVTNDLELADICTKSSGVISKMSILKNHPFVENAESEYEQIKEEKQEAMGEFGEGLFDNNFNTGALEAVKSDEEGKAEKENKQ